MPYDYINHTDYLSDYSPIPFAPKDKEKMRPVRFNDLVEDGNGGYVYEDSGDTVDDEKRPVHGDFDALV